MVHKFIFLLLVSIVCFGQSKLDDVEVLFQGKNYLKAEQVLTDYLHQNPRDLKAIELLGDTYGYQKQWDGAISNYKLLVDTNQSNANYHYKYGGALGMKALSVSKLRALGIIGDVKDAFLKAAKLDPNHIDTRWALVELYMQLPGILGGSTHKALQYANELEYLSKVDGYLAKGYIYEDDNEAEQAEGYYKKALQVGGSKTCYKKLSNFYLKYNEKDKALQVLNEGYKRLNDEELLRKIEEITM